MFRYRLDEDTELRLLEQRHAETLYGAIDDNREHLRPWMPWVGSTQAVADAGAYIERTLARFAANDGFDAGIWHRGALVGNAGFHAIDWANRSSSLGYWIARDHEGRGIVTAAVRALLGHAFAELRLHRMVIRCGKANLRSRAIPERLGFTEEGTLRQAEHFGDSYRDLVIYSLLEPEWRARLA